MAASKFEELAAELLAHSQNGSLEWRKGFGMGDPYVAGFPDWSAVISAVKSDEKAEAYQISIEDNASRSVEKEFALVGTPLGDLLDQLYESAQSYSYSVTVDKALSDLRKRRLSPAP